MSSNKMTAAQFRALFTGGARDLASITPEQITAVQGDNVSKHTTNQSENQRARGLTNHSRADMNKTERQYSGYLELRKIAGEIIEWRFQEIGFRLANRTWHHPDFWVQTDAGYIEIHETKGTSSDGTPHWTQDGWKTFKIAREQWRVFRWRLMYLDQGEWKEWGGSDG